MASPCGYYLVMAARSTRIRGQAGNTNDATHTTSYERHQNMSLSNRHSKYIDFVSDCPKMQCKKDYFSSRMAKTEKLLVESRNWLNSNKNGEKQQFLDHFCVDKWQKLSQSLRLQHSWENCGACSIDKHRHHSFVPGCKNDNNKNVTL